MLRTADQVDKVLHFYEAVNTSPFALIRSKCTPFKSRAVRAGACVRPAAALRDLRAPGRRCTAELERGLKGGAYFARA